MDALTLEGGKIRFAEFADHIRQHIQTSAMGHAEGNLVRRRYSRSPLRSVDRAAE